ncbi:MAG: HAD hydrolase-like protein [Lentisphaeria bacterium]|nr:HAD hydrolase-like protein [Lentisphaeria bacterium]
MRRIIMFDLDGTLIDSVGGIANSVNVTRRQFGFSPLPEEKIASFTGDGARKLLERSFADVSLPCPVEEAVKKMVTNYAADPLHGTKLYPGVAEGLRQLAGAGFLLAVVSNKPQEVGEKILAGLGVSPLLCDNIGGGRFPLKPAPDAFLHVIEKHGVSKENAWIAGDNHTDIGAAQAAGIRSVFCRYGFGTIGGTAPTFSADTFADLVAVVLAGSR